MRTALIAGSTGLVGKILLSDLLRDDYYTNVTVIVRRPLTISHPKLKIVVADFEKLSDIRDMLFSNDVFCCLGTTMKKAGSKETFRKVDHDYVLSLAQETFNLGAEQFLLVSALGADVKSSFFYNQVKGETEEAIGKVGFRSYHIFRPSLLLGPREEHRSGEEAAKTFYKLFDFLIPAKYKGIEASKVANAMIHFAKRNLPGTHIHHSAEMQSFNQNK